MLPLDSPRWTELRTARGEAGHVPDLLRRLAAEPWTVEQRGRRVAADLWRDLFLALCWQLPGVVGPIAGATWAALPHVVELIPSRPLAERLPALAFVGAVAAHAPVHGTPVPDLMPDYREALARAAPLVLEALCAGAWDEADTRDLLVALAAVLGQEGLARSLDGLPSLDWTGGQWFGACPRCRADLGVDGAGAIRPGGTGA